MLYHPTFMLYARYFPIVSINIPHKIRSTSELHRSSENCHSGVGKIVRCLRTSRKIDKITSRFKCIEINWALFKMIIFKFICFFVISYFFSSIYFSFLYFVFSIFSGTFMCIQVAMPCCIVPFVIVSHSFVVFTTLFCFSNKKNIGGEE